MCWVYVDARRVERIVSTEQMDAALHSCFSALLSDERCSRALMPAAAAGRICRMRSERVRGKLGVSPFDSSPRYRQSRSPGCARPRRKYRHGLRAAAGV